MTRHLRRGGVCVILVDEHYSGRVYGPRLGRDVPLAGNIVNAARFAAISGASLVVAHCERLGGARFRVIRGFGNRRR